jgi:hypothetical protein
MSGRRSWALVAVLIPPGVLAMGCGPVVGFDAESTSSSSGASEASSGTPELTTTGATTSVDDGGTTSQPTDTGEPPSGYEDDGVDTGCAFTCPDPPPPTQPPGGGWCNISCPEGEKCMPWANDGGSEWNAERCSPIDSNPGSPGEPCTVEGSQWSGIDDCDAGSLCWQVDPRTNEGTCHGFCGALDGEELCSAGHDCVLLPPDVPLCVVSCDPLASECDEGQRCLPSGSGFTCLVHDGLGFALGEPCDAPGACAIGGLCAHDPAVTCGNEPGQGCCAQPCDVNDPITCVGPEVCVPWFPLRPPPELAYLGVCAAP